MNTITIISTIINTVPAVVIAIFAWRNYTLSKSLKERQDKIHQDETTFKEEMKDIHSALVINALLGPNICTTDRITAFRKLYTGKTKFFDDNDLKKLRQ